MNTLELWLALSSLEGRIPSRVTLGELAVILQPEDYGRCASCGLDIAAYSGEDWLHIQGACRQCGTAAARSGSPARYGKHAAARPAPGPDGAPGGAWHEHARQAAAALIKAESRGP